MNISFNLNELRKIIPEFSSQGELLTNITGLASLSEACPGDLSFLSNAKYTSQVPSCKASLILLPKDYKGDPLPGQLFLFTENPSFALAQICRYIELQLWPKPEPGIHPTAFIDPTAQIDPSSTIGPFAYVGPHSVISKNVVINSHVHIGKNVTIDESSWLMPHVNVLDYCSIGKRVRLHSMVVIGADGFGFSTLKDGTHQRQPQIGRVIIEDDVDIGANTTIDRARFDCTRIGAGTKIDNLVQIGHNVVIGKHCLIVAQVGISGSTIIEDHVVIGGQTGVAGHIRIGKKSTIGGMSGVNRDLEPGSFVRGSPAYPYMLAQRLDVLRKRLPEIFKRVDNLENEIKLLQTN